MDFTTTWILPRSPGDPRFHPVHPSTPVLSRSDHYVEAHFQAAAYTPFRPSFDARLTEVTGFDYLEDLCPRLGDWGARVPVPSVGLLMVRPGPLQDMPRAWIHDVR